MKYTVKNLRADFPNDAACLKWLVQYLYPGGINCVRCEEKTKHYPVSGRRSYVCSRCGNHFYPTAGTIFHGSRTPLTDWFHAIYLMSSNKAGTSAKQIERELGVTYKTAWRMMHKIRFMMAAPEEKLLGDVEVDESYVHPNVYKRSSARRQYGHTGARRGQILFGMIERGGRAKIWHVRAPGARVLLPIISSNVHAGSTVHSDSYGAYRRLPKLGFTHRTTNHTQHEYYRTDSYTQNVENLWSHLKRGIKGVYRHVDPAYLQLYADEYAWRYSHRMHPVLFWHLLTDVISPS